MERGWERGQIPWDPSVLAMKFSRMRQESLGDDTRIMLSTEIPGGGSPGILHLFKIGWYSEFLGKRASQMPYKLRTLLHPTLSMPGLLPLRVLCCTLNKEVASSHHLPSHPADTQGKDRLRGGSESGRPASPPMISCRLTLSPAWTPAKRHKEHKAWW